MTVAKAKPARAALWLAAVSHNALAILVLVLVLVVPFAALAAHALAALTIMLAVFDLHDIAWSF
jgi:hypothetical protein